MNCLMITGRWWSGGTNLRRGECQLRLFILRHLRLHLQRLPSRVFHCHLIEQIVHCVHRSVQILLWLKFLDLSSAILAYLSTFLSINGAQLHWCQQTSSRSGGYFMICRTLSRIVERGTGCNVGWEVMLKTLIGAS